MARRKKKDALERLQPKPPTQLSPTTDLSNLRLRPAPLVSGDLEGGQQQQQRRGRLLNLLGLGSALVAAGSAAAGRLDIASAAAGLGQGLTAGQEAVRQQQAQAEREAFQRQAQIEQLRLAQEDLALRRADLLRRAQESEEERALREREMQLQRELTEKELQTRREIAVLSNASRLWDSSTERTMQAEVLSGVASEYMRQLATTWASAINLQQQGQLMAAQDMMSQLARMQEAVVRQIEQLSRVDPVRANRLLQLYRNTVVAMTRAQTAAQQQGQTGQ